MASFFNIEMAPERIKKDRDATMIRLPHPQIENKSSALGFNDPLPPNWIRWVETKNYFGCFFSLPIVISSMRWGLDAGRKTMVATAMLLLTLSGPVKASTYLLMHGLVGVTMGSLWRLGINWGVSVVLCTIVRALGAIGYVLISSFLIRENILNLITINIHASLTYILMAIGVNTIPTMDTIYSIFGSLLLLNCGFFVFLLHVLYAIFLSKLGMKESLTLPGWLEKAI